MKVSIITVTYNSERTLVDTLRSVAEQDYRDIEHVVIDGGSRDGTLDVLKRHGAHVARSISEPDGGIYDAMNKGMALATGDFVGFLNSDDTLASRGAISSLVSRAHASDVVYGDLDYVAEDGRRVIRHWRSGSFAFEQLRFGWMPPHPTFYVRRTLMQEIGRFDVSFRIAADYEYMLRCLLRESVRVGYVDEVLVRMRAGGVSNRSISTMLRKSREDLTVMRRHRIGGVSTLAAKNLRKLPQFLSRSVRRVVPVDR